MFVNKADLFNIDPWVSCTPPQSRNGVTLNVFLMTVIKINASAVVVRYNLMCM